MALVAVEGWQETAMIGEGRLQRGHSSNGDERGMAGEGGDLNRELGEQREGVCSEVVGAIVRIRQSRPNTKIIPPVP